MWDTILVILIHMFMVVWSYMEPVTGTTPGTERYIIHARLHGDLEYTGIPGPDGDFHLDSVMVGSVGVFILTAVGGGHVAIAMVIVMGIATDTDVEHGPAIELVIGQAREAAHEMYTVTGLRVLEPVM